MVCNFIFLTHLIVNYIIFLGFGRINKAIWIHPPVGTCFTVTSHILDKYYITLVATKLVIIHSFIFETETNLLPVVWSEFINQATLQQPSDVSDSYVSEVLIGDLYCVTNYTTSPFSNWEKSPEKTEYSCKYRFSGALNEMKPSLLLVSSVLFLLW